MVPLPPISFEPKNILFENTSYADVLLTSADGVLQVSDPQEMTFSFDNVIVQPSNRFQINKPGLENVYFDINIREDGIFTLESYESESGVVSKAITADINIDYIIYKGQKYQN